MVPLVSRTGRELQKHTADGGRIVVGCIPYRINSHDGSIEVLVITSQKGKGMLFPKGGWEIDESIKDAVCREAVEESGVQGEIKDFLGKWEFKSKRFDQMYEGHMYSLYVTKELDLWPEKNVRNRKWITVAEAREGCQYWWMIEALEIFATNMSRTCKSQFSDVGVEDQKQGNCLLENEITNKYLHVERDGIIRSLEEQRNCEFQEAKQRNCFIVKEIAPRFSQVEKDEETLSVGKHRCCKSYKRRNCTFESQLCSQVKEDEGSFSVRKQRNCKLHHGNLRKRNCNPDHGVFPVKKQRIFKLDDAKRRNCNRDHKLTSKSSQVEANRLFTIQKQLTTESHVDDGAKSIVENHEHRYPQNEIVMRSLEIGNSGLLIDEKHRNRRIENEIHLRSPHPVKLTSMNLGFFTININRVFISFTKVEMNPKHSTPEHCRLILLFLVNFNKFCWEWINHSSRTNRICKERNETEFHNLLAKHRDRQIATQESDQYQRCKLFYFLFF